MSATESPRRILIVDDLVDIHETFRRVFNDKRRNESDLDDFEAKFLTAAKEPARANSPVNELPTFSLCHTMGGEEATREVRRASKEGQPFSVAFVDMRMPKGMDGLETIEKLWEIDPTLQIVICTAFSDHTWDEILSKLGYSDRLLLLRKPFDADEARQLALALSEKYRMAVRQRTKLRLLRDEVRRRRSAESAMREMAHRDALTDLPNRPFLIEKLDRMLQKRESRSKETDAILFLDLDNFKIINDSLGHEAGDELLNQVATRLQECVRDRENFSTDVSSRRSDNDQKARRTDETIRLGGDEFVVVLEQLGRREDASVVARRIVRRIGEPFLLGDRMVTVGTSVGVAYLDENSKDAHDVLRNADTAMYQAKNFGKGQVAVFDQTMRDAVVARHEMEAQLRTALQQEQFQLRYQPIVSLVDGSIRGVEVFTRWPSEDGNYVPPSQFIPVAEEIGLINQFGEWVLERSMSEMSEMLQSFAADQQPDFYVSVNVSRRQLGDPFFTNRLSEIVKRTQFGLELKLEMSEDGEMRHNEQSLQTMLDLYQQGVGIHIDDFGKGSSSLMCFHDYPIETVKIDRNFTASIAVDNGHAIITQAIVQLAHHLMAKIVCQGLESPKQVSLLQQWGCDLGQGYFFAPPLDVVELGRLLNDPEISPGIRLLSAESPKPIITPEMPSGGFGLTNA
ncbi:MAG: EAL domain-containing protein [Planctomycetota bacterium]